MSSPWYTKTILDSGLPVLVAPTDSPSVTLILLFRTGSSNEDAREAGISHFLEHFVFKGTQKYPTSQDVMRALDSLGADHNAGTGKESTAYWIKVAVAHVARAVEVLGEVVFRPRLPEDLLTLEKGTILQEKAMYEDQPGAKVGENFEFLLYGKTSRLGRAIIGTNETIAGVTREDLVRYRQRWYRPERAVLAVAGGMAMKDVLPLVERAWGKKWEIREESQEKRNTGHKDENNSLVRLSDARRVIEWRKTDQVHLAMGVPGIARRDPRRYALGVFLTMLGGNSSSRLFVEIREKRGLAYAIRSGATKYDKHGYVAIGAGVPTQKAPEVEKLIAEICRNFSFTDREFSDAKSYLTGQFALDWEESHYRADHLADDYLFEPAIRSFEEIVERLNSVTREDVEALQKQLFGSDQPFYVSAVGMVDEELMKVEKGRKR